MKRARSAIVSRDRGRRSSSSTASTCQPSTSTQIGAGPPKAACNVSNHQTPDVQKWLRGHKRFHFHFTPTSASWLNQI